MTVSDAFEHVTITQSDMLWDWLALNHAQDQSIWLVTWKAAHPDTYVSREAVLDALIAYGWIDGLRRKVDAQRTKQLISLRRQAIWADSYKRRVARLEAEVRMQDPGRAQFAWGKANGTWAVLGHVDALSVPQDLADAPGPAQTWFDTAAPSYRRNVLRWIAQAKRADTRQKRIATLSEHCARGAKMPNY